MRVNYVLIDYENVQPPSLALLEPECFQVLLFVGQQQKRMPLDVVLDMQRMGRRAQYIEISGKGCNALDFHIAYYIGRVAIENPSAAVHIVSKDTGFDPLICHLRKNGMLASRCADLSAIPLIHRHLAAMQERYQALSDRLRDPKAPRPRTAKALENWVATQLNQQPDDPSVAEAIARLRADGRVAINGCDVIYRPVRAIALAS